MNREVTIICVALITACEGKKTEATSCEVVAQRFVELKTGEPTSFMTERERALRARWWIAKCEPMTETTRKCVLAATTMAQAEACGGDALSRDEGATAKAAWVLRAGDASYQAARFVALANDGDVIAAGDFEGSLELGGQVSRAQRTDAWVARLSPTGAVRWAKSVGGTGRDYLKGIALGMEDSIMIAVHADEAPRFSHVMFAADGTVTPTPIATEHGVDAAALYSNGDVVIGSRTIEPVRGGTCAAPGFVVQRFMPDGKRVWSRCNDGKRKVTFTDEPMQLAAGPDGMTAVCAGFLGPIAWGGNAAPAGSSDERAFVLVLDAKGEPRWVGYVGGMTDVLCDALAVSDDRSVIAIVRGATPGSALALWEPDGTQRWMRSCSDLLGIGEDCELSAVTTSGSDVVVAAQSGARTVFATIDSETAKRKQSSSFARGTSIKRIAARQDMLVFATRFFVTVDFGTGPVEATRSADGFSLDALIGRL